MKTSRNTRNNAGQEGHSGKRKNKENIFRRRPFAKYMQVKLAITVLLISLALFALVYVLYRIVNENNERYNKIVLYQRQQEYASRTIPDRRGDIVDRNGTYLATVSYTHLYAALKDAMAAGNAPEAFRGAHTLKGVAQNLGFGPLYKAAAQVLSLIHILADTAHAYGLKTEDGIELLIHARCV